MSKRLCVLSDTELDYMVYVEDHVRKTTEFLALGRRQELLRDQIVQSNEESSRKKFFKEYEEVMHNWKKIITDFLLVNKTFSKKYSR